MYWLIWATHLIIGLGIILSGFLAKDTLEKYSQWSTVLGLLFGYVSTALNLHYNRDPRVYAFVNRMLLRFMRDHTYWELSIAFEFEPRELSECRQLLDQIESKLRGVELGAVRVPIKTSERMELTLDNLFDFSFRLESGRLDVSLGRRLTVPVHAYDEFQRLLLDVAESIQNVVKADEIACDVQVYFRKGRPNPFYGFFVSRVPAKLLDTFQVVFRLDQCPDCRIEASKDHVGVQANSPRKMFAGLDEVLNYRALPTLVEAR